MKVQELETYKEQCRKSQEDAKAFKAKVPCFIITGICLCLCFSGMWKTDLTTSVIRDGKWPLQVVTSVSNKGFRRSHQ